MSTFKGIFREIPGIAVDRFEGDCLQSRFLFLSHCHADHMVGLSTLETLSIPLFTSEISAVFLKKQFPNVSNAIQTLEIETPLELTYCLYGKPFDLVVTALPAKHCPGSVMFLFETESNTVLYTGDFRILKNHFHHYDILRNKTINSLHLDSTFLSERYNEFPTQIESISKICSLISEWLEMTPENKILIEMPAQYGIEFLFIAIQKKLRQKIYVNETQWQKYVYLPAMDECISPDAAKCRIFTKFKGSCGSQRIVSKHFRVIKPSAMFWSNWKRGKPFVLKVGNKNEYRVAYSNHSSCSELKDFLNFTQPMSVSLNVVPENYETCYLNCLERIYAPAKEEIVDFKEEEKELCFDNIFLVSNESSGKESSVEIKFPPKRLKL